MSVKHCLQQVPLCSQTGEKLYFVKGWRPTSWVLYLGNSWASSESSIVFIKRQILFSCQPLAKEADLI